MKDDGIYRAIFEATTGENSRKNKGLFITILTCFKREFFLSNTLNAENVGIVYRLTLSNRFLVQTDVHRLQNRPSLQLVH